jgi:glycosyltransferase involved in cell wall biosynthesis
MRIAQISTVATPVQAEGSGSVEGLVWLLSRELRRMGHEVTIFGVEGSDAGGDVVSTLPGPYGSPGSPYDWQQCEWINLCRAVERSGQFDIVHSHAYLWGTPLNHLSQAPMLHTMHVSPYENDARLWQLAPDSCVTAISRYQWSSFPELHPAAVIYHGVDAEQFTLQTSASDYVCYLGRFIPGKGPLQAIAAARSLGLRLLLAGPRNPYFRQHIEPLLDDNSVEYVGFMSGAEKNRLLGGARALLYPVQSPEPFGLVLIEAMMCGTPVVATRLGAVPEIIDEGVTGYLVPSADALADRLPMAFALDRRSIRAQAETRFAAHRMAGEYLQLYAHVTGSVLSVVP